MATMELRSLRHRKTHSDSSTRTDSPQNTTHLVTGTDLSTAHPPPYSNISILPDSFTPPPEPTSPEYKSYAVLNDSCLNITLHAHKNSPPLYTIINSTFTPGVPDVTLHAGPRTTPPIGAAHLSLFTGANQFGVRTTAARAFGGMEGMVWEELLRGGFWTHAIYTFDWMWADGERRKYEWRRTSSPFLLDDQSDLELVEMGREGMVLARYQRGALLRWTVRGQLDVRVLSGEWGVEEGERWETVVLLTAMSLVELARRRARARRKV